MTKFKQILKMAGDISTGYLLHMAVTGQPELLWVVFILLIIPRIVFILW